MKKRNSIISFAICFFFLCAGCAANINRQGYVIDESKINNNKCNDVIVVKSLTYDPKLVDILGKISASDTGFSTECSEAFVIKSFTKDACSIGADIINITNESQPDFWSTCYRSEAEFIRVKDRKMLANIKTAPEYSAENIAKSSSYTDCMKNAPAASVLGGLVGFLIIHNICKSSDTGNSQSTNQESGKVGN